jgi:hypothetical protein
MTDTTIGPYGIGDPCKEDEDGGGGQSLRLCRDVRENCSVGNWGQYGGRGASRGIGTRIYMLGGLQA